MSYVQPTVLEPRNGTLLVVEDELSLREAIARMLRMEGFEVFEAADGSAAIDILRLRGDKIDLMLLDMTIPGAPSHEVAIEAMKVQPDMRVILTSAFGKEIISGSMNASQTHGFIRKPFRIQDLLNLLRTTLASQPIAEGGRPRALNQSGLGQSVPED
jgi:DNA-binding NtrC family response regulator